MSDYQQDPGATQVLPAVPPASPPAPPGAPSGGPAPGRRRGVPWWAVLLIALFVGLLGAGVAWTVVRLSRGGSDPVLTQLQQQNADLQKKVDDLASQLVTLTAETEAAKTTEPAGASAGEEPAPTGPTTPTATKQFAFVTKMIWDDPDGPYHVTLDYAQFLTGTQAAAAAAAHGDESPPPNDYYIVNDNKKLRIFTAKPDVPVTAYGWGGGDSSAKSSISFGQWFDVMPGGASPKEPWKSTPYWVTVKGTEITKVEQQYLP